VTNVRLSILLNYYFICYYCAQSNIFLLCDFGGGRIWKGTHALSCASKHEYFAILYLDLAHSTSSACYCTMLRHHIQCCHTYCVYSWRKHAALLAARGSAQLYSLWSFDVRDDGGDAMSCMRPAGPKIAILKGAMRHCHYYIYAIHTAHSIPKTHTTTNQKW